MSEYGLPVLYALFVWWFSTGVILYLDGLPPRTFRWSMLGATAILALSFYGLAASGAEPSVAGAYAAFTCGLLAWGWQEISYYMGFVTGPRKAPCPEGCAGWRHFWHAVQTTIYHELAIIAAAAAVVALTWDAPNQIGMWTFMVLWWMHLSAKLNVFLGVRNLNEEFLPEHLWYLRGFLTKKPMNLLFPVSVTVSTVIAIFLVQKAAAPEASAFQATGFTFLATLMVLAILEHWFLVLPLPAAALWNWGLRSRQAGTPCDVEVVCGFLGAGKSTFVRRSLARDGSEARTVALLNDFGALGGDVSVLRGQGDGVTELPNGRVCCSLRQDLAVQLREVIARWAPQRVIIEPSGLADVSALLRLLERPDTSNLVKTLRVYGVVDAGAFLRDVARMPEFFEAQASLASVFVVSKTDLVSAGELAVVEHTLRELNPDVPVVGAVHGRVEAQALQGIPGGPARPGPPRAGKTHREAACAEFRSWSTRLSRPCDPKGLHDVLEAVARGAFGEVARVKGVARAGSGWVQFGVAGGRSSMTAFAAHEREEPRVIAIGRGVDEARLQAAFEACAAPAAEPA